MTNYITFNDVTDKYQMCDDEISDSILVKQNENSRLDVSSIDAYGSDKIFFDKGLALERHRKRRGGGEFLTIYCTGENGIKLTI